MGNTKQSAIAVIADAHCHDMDSEYGLKSSPLAGRAATLRSWHDSRRASRLFNESTTALLHALDDIRHRGIRHVILLGDYTDDGQTEATARLHSRLLEYQQQYDMAFLAIPGNHDCYGPQGKHQSTRFVSVPGKTVLVTSNPAHAATEDDAILTAAMYCQGTPTAVQSMGEFGLHPQPGYLHWETPFGATGDIAARRYTAYSADGRVMRSLTDASYLVEPIAGLWLLMIDANVFEPRNGDWRETQKKAFLDSSDAGWNSLLRNRTHLLPWITDVCRRAGEQNKQLIGFSHYPVIDPFNDFSDSEKRLFGQSDMRRRRPSDEVARALIEAGLTLHFGGHLHVNAYRQYQLGTRQLTDVAVPSTATFPAAYQIIHVDNNHRTERCGNSPDAHSAMALETVPLNDMPLNPDLLDYYRAEIRATQAPDDLALSASCYGEFLYHRMSCRVAAHHLSKEWPDELVQALPQSNAAELAIFLLSQQHSAQPLDYESTQYASTNNAASPEITAGLRHLCEQAGLTLAELEACRLSRLITDWYCLRQAGHQACSFFEPANLRSYQFLARHFGDLTPADQDTQAAFLQVFLGVLQQLLHDAIPGKELIIPLDARQAH